MAVMTISFLFVVYLCAKWTLEYHAVRDGVPPLSPAPSREGEAMPDDMWALMWADL